MAIWLLEGSVKVRGRDRTGGRKTKMKKGFYALAFGKFVFFNTNNHIGRMIALCFISWLVFVLFLNWFHLIV